MRIFAIALLACAAPAVAEVSVVDNNKTLTIDCKKDPEVSLIGNKITVTLVGTCKAVTVTGNHENVTGTATKFYIAGNDNTVTADGADEIFVAGNRNTVSWKRGVAKKAPAITNPGKDNKVTQQK
jgi:hypothetical protein